MRWRSCSSRRSSASQSSSARRASTSCLSTSRRWSRQVCRSASSPATGSLPPASCAAISLRRACELRAAAPACGPATAPATPAPRAATPATAPAAAPARRASRAFMRASSRASSSARRSLSSAAGAVRGRPSGRRRSSSRATRLARLRLRSPSSCGAQFRRARRRRAPRARARCRCLPRGSAAGRRVRHRRRCAMYSSRCASSRARSASMRCALRRDPRASACSGDFALPASDVVRRARGSRARAPARRPARLRAAAHARETRAQPLAVRRDHGLAGATARRARARLVERFGGMHARRACASAAAGPSHAPPACRFAPPTRSAVRQQRQIGVRQRRRGLVRERCGIIDQRGFEPAVEHGFDRALPAGVRPAALRRGGARCETEALPAIVAGRTLVLRRAPRAAALRATPAGRARSAAAAGLRPERGLRLALVVEHLFERGLALRRALRSVLRPAARWRVVLAVRSARQRLPARRRRLAAVLGFQRSRGADQLRAPGDRDSRGACARPRRHWPASPSRRRVRIPARLPVGQLRLGSAQRLGGCLVRGAQGSPAAARASASATRSVSSWRAIVGRCARPVRRARVRFRRARAAAVRPVRGVCWICCSTRAISAPTL